MVSSVHNGRVFHTTNSETLLKNRISYTKWYSYSSRYKYHTLYWCNIPRYSLCYDWWICTSKSRWSRTIRYTLGILWVHTEKGSLVQYTRLREEDVHHRRSEVSERTYVIHEHHNLSLRWITSNSMSHQESISRISPSAVSRTYTKTSQELYFKQSKDTCRKTTQTYHELYYTFRRISLSSPISDMEKIIFIVN
jgi:hypothetical protein